MEEGRVEEWKSGRVEEWKMEDWKIGRWKIGRLTRIFWITGLCQDKMEEWKREEGRWKMEDGRWKMEDGRMGCVLMSYNLSLKLYGRK